MIYNLVLLHGLNIILSKKANGPYEACASAWEVLVCFLWCLSIAKITLSSCHLNWLRAIFLLKQHMSAWRAVCLWHNLFSLSHPLKLLFDPLCCWYFNFSFYSFGFLFFLNYFLKVLFVFNFIIQFHFVMYYFFQFSLYSFSF
jgi:hypothetical protein